MAASPSSQPAGQTAAALAREVYWGTQADPGTTDLGSILDRLDHYARRMRVEQRQLLPIGETVVDSATPWKRWVKRTVWRLTRFSTMRYDRLLAELAEMNGELARRLQEAEEEVADLRQRVPRPKGEDA
jgi:hypothetical protein